MTEIEILSEDKRKEIKRLLNCLDLGLDNFNYGCICNRIYTKNGKVTNTIKGFQGQGLTDSLAVLSLIKDIWKHLLPEEKEEIKGILNE